MENYIGLVILGIFILMAGSSVEKGLKAIAQQIGYLANAVANLDLYEEEEEPAAEPTE